MNRYGHVREVQIQVWKGIGGTSTGMNRYGRGTSTGMKKVWTGMGGTSTGMNRYEQVSVVLVQV